MHCWLFNVKQILVSVKVNSKITNDLRQNPGPVKVNGKIHRLHWSQDFSQRFLYDLKIRKERQYVWRHVLPPVKLVAAVLSPSKGSRQVYHIRVSQTGMPWQGTHRLPGLGCAETGGTLEVFGPKANLLCFAGGVGESRNLQGEGNRAEEASLGGFSAAHLTGKGGDGEARSGM